MKFLLLCSILFTNILFANNTYTNENSGKIDMHGGKSEMLINNKNSLSNGKLNELGNIGITKPQSPIAPATLIKNNEKKEEKKETNK